MTNLKFTPFILFSLLPLRILYVLSDIIFLFLYYVFKYRRDVVRKNLTESFPEKSDKEILSIEKDFYKHFCDMFAENLNFMTISAKNAKRRLVIKNPELILEYNNKKQSIIAYSAHFGNWELMATLPLYLPFKVTALYQTQKSKYFTKVINLIRERFGVIAIPSEKGYKKLMEFKKFNIQTMTIMVGDQSPHPGGSIHWVNFLNRETGFIPGAERIAPKSNQPLVFPMMTKKKRGHYEIDFLPIHNTPGKAGEGEITKKYAQLLEIAIQTQPHLWLWSHNRWKRKRVKPKKDISLQKAVT